MAAQTYQGMRFYKCCMDCPRRTPACSDRCADYMIAKAFKGAEKQICKLPLSQRQRNTNGRK